MSDLLRSTESVLVGSLCCFIVLSSSFYASVQYPSLKNIFLTINGKHQVWRRSRRSPVIHARIANQQNQAPPPPINQAMEPTMQQFFEAQMQLIKNLTNTIQNM
jgi:hypothetical protein